MEKQKALDARNLRLAGEKCYEEKKFEEALAYFKKVLALNPDNFVSYIQAAEILRQLKKPKEAICSLIQAQVIFNINLVQENPEAVNNPWEFQAINYYLALCWKDLNDLQKSVALLQTAARELFVVLDGQEQGENAELEAKFQKISILEATGEFGQAYELLQPLVDRKLAALLKKINLQDGVAIC